MSGDTLLPVDSAYVGVVLCLCGCGYWGVLVIVSDVSVGSSVSRLTPLINMYEGKLEP